MSVNDDNEDKTNKQSDKNETEPKASCPFNETWRHVLYIGGMVALHAGMGATASVAGKTHKCPIGEWGRHAVYTGGLVALIAMMAKGGCGASKITDEATSKDDEPTKQKWYQVCPLDEWGKHAVYVAGVVGLVALVNARKK